MVFGLTGTGAAIAIFLGASVAAVLTMIAASMLKNARGRAKGIAMSGTFLLVLVVGTVFAAGAIGNAFPSLVAPDGVLPGGQAILQAAAGVEGCPAGVSTIPSPTVTFTTQDKYLPGTAVTTKNMFRRAGQELWTNVAGAGTTTALNVGETIEVAVGIDTTDESTEPYGPLFEYIVPCEEQPTLLAPDANGVNTETILVSNDALATDLTFTSFDENGQVQAADTTNVQDVGAGDVKNMEIKWVSTFREDFGDVQGCGKMSNVLVAQYNTTDWDDITVLSGGVELADAAVPTVHTKTTGFSDKAWQSDVLESVADVRYTVVVDADDSTNPSAASGNITWSLYDSSKYLDNDVNQVFCGVEDENDNEIGATAADTGTSLIS